MNAQNLNKTADYSAKDLSFDDIIDMGDNTCSKIVENKHSNDHQFFDSN